MLTVKTFHDVQMYLVHEEMVTYQTNGQTFADFCFKWANQPSVFQPPIKKCGPQRTTSTRRYVFPVHLNSQNLNIWKVIGRYVCQDFSLKTITRIGELSKSLPAKPFLASLLGPKRNQSVEKSINSLDSPGTGFDRPQEPKKMVAILVSYLTCQNPKISRFSPGRDERSG